MPTLHLQVCAGFANRIRALVSGICAAEHLGLPLVIHWPSSGPECAAKAHRLLDAESLPKTVKVVGQELYNPREVLNREEWDTILAGWDKTRDLNLKSYGIFYSNETYEDHLRRLKPSSFVKELLSRRTASLDWSTAVGVHIRRTDNWRSILGSPLESFVERLKAEEASLFVVATDDSEVRTLLVSMFGPKVLFPATVLSRMTEEGMIHAVTDFFAVSNCSKLLGSIGSSFSEMAALHGSIPLELVT